MRLVILVVCTIVSMSVIVALAALVVREKRRADKIDRKLMREIERADTAELDEMNARCELEEAAARSKEQHRLQGVTIKQLEQAQIRRDHSLRAMSSAHRVLTSHFGRNEAAGARKAKLILAKALDG